MPRLRRPRLPALPRPRALTPAEVVALQRRPWPRLPWWLWLAVLLTTGAMVTVAAVLLLGPEPEQVPLGARRSPPPADGSRSHEVGPTLAPPAGSGPGPTAGRPACTRLGQVVLVGTAEEVELLRRAADELCALRSTPAIERARRGLQDSRAAVSFAAFTSSGNESTLVLPPGGRATVWVNAKFARGDPERITVLLVHEGTHAARLATASGTRRPVSGPDELAARQAELEACRRLFPDWSRANRGCRDAEDLLGQADPLARLREAGYR